MSTQAKLDKLKRNPALYTGLSKELVDILEEIISETSNTTVMEYRARLAQSGTSAPSVQKLFVDGITVGTNPNANPDDIIISYEYTGVGEFAVRISYGSGVSLNATDFDVSFSDAKIRASSFASGVDGFSDYLLFNFKSYNTSGTLANGVILFSNIYIKRYGV